MYTILTYSYLLLPLLLLFFKSKRKEPVLVILAGYGIFAFAYLTIDIKNLPVSLWAAYALSFTTIEYLCFASFFYLSLDNKPAKKVILALSFAFILFQILFYFSVKDNQFRLDTIPIGVETILLFVYIFIFFYDSLKSNKQVNLYNNFGFWVSVGVLSYLGVSFFFYILANDMRIDEIDQYWVITFIAEIIKNIMFCIAIIMYLPKKNLQNERLKQSQQDSIPHLI